MIGSEDTILPSFEFSLEIMFMQVHKNIYAEKELRYVKINELVFKYPAAVAKYLPNS